MKKLLLSIIAFSAITLTQSCNNGTTDAEKPADSTGIKKDSTNPEPQKPADSTTTAAFKIVKAGDDADPKSVVYVVVNGKENKVEEVAGTLEPITAKDFASHQIPATAKEAYGAWWAGQGTYYYLAVNGKEVELYKGWQAEEVSPKEGYHWKKEKTFK